MSTFKLTAQEAAFLRAMDRMKKMPIVRLYSNLAPPEVHLMACVSSEPDGRTVSSLTKALDMPMPAVSRLMRGMEERGLITRSILPQDRRSVVVRVTPKGEQQLQEFQVCFHTFFEQVVDVADPERFDQAIQGWNMLLDRMEMLLLERPAPGNGMPESLPPPMGDLQQYEALREPAKSGVGEACVGEACVGEACIGETCVGEACMEGLAQDAPHGGRARGQGSGRCDVTDNID